MQSGRREGARWRLLLVIGVTVATHGLLYGLTTLATRTKEGDRDDPVWNGVVIAEAERTRPVEGNHYFPPESRRREYFTDSPTRSLCPWNGIAHDYLLTVDGEVNPDAAWYYPHPLSVARLLGIKNHVTF
ncbi:MAG TPA: DUF427 domain-containing protein [Thermopolyspora sp.]